MSIPDDGGPAFAVLAITPAGDEIGHPGMSLRDFFAAQALPALITESYSPEMLESSRQIIMRSVAASAYTIADLMLAARKA